MPATLKHQKLQLLADPLTLRIQVTAFHNLMVMNHLLWRQLHSGQHHNCRRRRRQHPPSPPQPVTIAWMINTPLSFYTDGACQGNGTEGARAGVGVFYGKNDPRNISTSLQGKHQTNQRAELTAIKLALEGIVNKPGACDNYAWNTTKKSKTSASASTRKKQVIIIKSDSNYCVKGFKHKF